jgi:predicted porin
LRATGYVQFGKSNGGGTRQRFIGNVSYKSKAVTLAAEIGVGQDSTNATHPKQKQQTISAYGVFNLPKSKAALIARVDIFDPNTDSTSAATNATGANKQTRFIGGVSYAISPNLRVLLDLDSNSLENGSANSFDKSRSMLFFHTEIKF